MAVKVIWNTGDTITADKLNGSGTYAIPLAMTGDTQTTPGTTAKDVLDAAKAGKVICLLNYEEDEAGVYYGCDVMNYVTKAGTNVSMGNGQTEYTATYPDGIFTNSGRE